MKKKTLVSFAIYWVIFAGVVQAAGRDRLIFTDAKVTELKGNISRRSEVANAWKEILAIADKAAEKKDLRNAEHLSLAYLMTKDEKYAEAGRQILLNWTARKDWYDKEMMARTPAWHSHLGLAHNGYNAALLYDAVYDYLPAKERKQIAEDLMRLGVVPAFEDWILEPTRIHSLNSMGHNWWSACSNLGGILALAIRNEVPEAGKWADKLCTLLPQWFAFDGDELQHKPRSFDRNGGMYESFGYADYGIQESLLFRLAYKNTHPGKALPVIPELEKVSNFFLQMTYPTKNYLYNANFGDGSMVKPALNTILLLNANGIRNADTDWYMHQVDLRNIEYGYRLNTPIGILYTPQFFRVPDVPKLPHTQLFPDFGIALMRDSWKSDATMLAVKSGFTWNHAHADANSFILFHKGHDIIKDGGNCNYGLPEYPEYFFQSQAHNVVLFNGEGQPTEQQYGGSPLRGYLYHLLDGGNIKYVLADGTGPVAKNFTRNFRHFLWIDNVIYIIDDLKTYTVGKFEWLWHPGGESKKIGMDISIVNNSSSVLLRPLYPETLIRTGFNHDFPEKMKLMPLQGPKAHEKGVTETYYSVRYPEEVRKVKAVNAIILKDSPNDTDLPEIEKIEGKNWIGLRVKNKGTITDIYINQLADGNLMHLNSCIQADGWDTDAYMFAIQYKQGASPATYKDLFVAYGSYLRRDGKSYYSSLSKEFVITNKK